jgi:DNA-binding NtrC family response regulator
VTGVSDKPDILIIDDRHDIHRYCERHLGEEYAFTLAPDGHAARHLLARKTYRATLLDRDFSHAPPDRLLGPQTDVRDEGLSILRCLRPLYPDLPVIMVTGIRDCAMAVAVNELGADFLAWEDVATDPASLAGRLRKAVGSRREVWDSALAEFGRVGIVTASPALAQALMALDRALPTRAPILLLGETGTGKDKLAKAIHDRGGDPERPFVMVNVANLIPGLVESELFGKERGAHSDAVRATRGKLRSADGGTLFLNEIGDLPLDLQSKLLTVLESGAVEPVGGDQKYTVTFRLITATSLDLTWLVRTGRFRRDLYYRIAGHVVTLPPLRERREDVPLLAQAFLEESAPYRSGEVRTLSREAVELLATHPWWGNLRQMRHVIQNAAAVASHTVTVADVLDALRAHERTDLPPEADGPSRVGPQGTDQPSPTSPPNAAEAEALAFAGRTYEQVTAAYYRYLLKKVGGQIARLAHEAGIGKTTAYEWKRRFGEPRADVVREK